MNSPQRHTDFTPLSCVPHGALRYNVKPTAQGTTAAGRPGPSPSAGRIARPATARPTPATGPRRVGAVVAHETANHDPQRPLPLTDDPQCRRCYMPASASAPWNVQPITTGHGPGHSAGHHPGHSRPLQKRRRVRRASGSGNGRPRYTRVTPTPWRDAVTTRRPRYSGVTGWLSSPPTGRPRTGRARRTASHANVKIGKIVKMVTMFKNCSRGCRISNHRPWRYRK